MRYRIFPDRKDTMRQYAPHSCKRSKTVLLIILLMVLVTRSSRAQSESSPQNSATPDASGDNSALLKELDAMKQRIEELESQLRAKHATDTPAASSAPSATALTTPPASAGVPVVTAKASTPTPTVPAEPSTEQPAPFGFADFTWLNGNPRTKGAAFDSKFFTPEIRADIDYTYDFRHPQDDTISGSSEIFRANEVQLT